MRFLFVIRVRLEHGGDLNAKKMRDFSCNRMANVSAFCNTLISIFRTSSISFLSYLKKFFCEVLKGHKDYENLMPMTIGINTDKL